MPNNLMSSPCLVCKQKRDTSKLNHLRRLLRDLEHLSVDKQVYSHRFNWRNHSRCRYGLHCSDLNQYDCECDGLCRQLDPYLEAVAMDKNNTRDYTLILRSCQGYYPQVYHEVVVLRNSGK